MRLTREQVRTWHAIAVDVLAMLPAIGGHPGSVEKIADLAADWLEMEERMRLAEARVKEFVDTR